MVEMANRSANEDFRVVRLITLPNAAVTKDSGNLTISGLSPSAAYRFRVRPLQLDGHGVYSDVITPGCLRSQQIHGSVASRGAWMKRPRGLGCGSLTRLHCYGCRPHGGDTRLRPWTITCISLGTGQELRVQPGAQSTVSTATATTRSVERALAVRFTYRDVVASAAASDTAPSA